MRKQLFFVVCFLIAVYVINCILSNPAAAFDAVDKKDHSLRGSATQCNTWEISYQLGQRIANYYQCDASDDYIYFSYSKYSCVDVYNMDGVFLYSYIFPDMQNGSMNVRCEDNYIYIGAKDNSVHIFDGVEEVAHLSRDEAIENGYDFSWFREENSRMKVNSEWICVLNYDGTEEIRIPTPSVIQKNIPPTNAMINTIPIVILMGIMLLLVLAFVQSGFHK